jgi:hypothetical protein
MSEEGDRVNRGGCSGVPAGSGRRRFRRRSVGLLLLVLLLGGAGWLGRAGEEYGQEPLPGSFQRQTYTITFLGIAVARAMLEQACPEDGSGPWEIRGSARSTAFWERFFRLSNSYTTRVEAGTFLPLTYERLIDERGRRWRRLEQPEGGMPTPSGSTARLPPLPERYRMDGEPDRDRQVVVPAGRYNLFAALWKIRYHPWEQTPALTLPLWVDGEPWRLLVSLQGVEQPRVAGQRLLSWRVRCRFERESQGTRRSATDYVTGELVRVESDTEFWVEQSPERRIVAVEVRRPGITVKGTLREPFADERRP